MLSAPGNDYCKVSPPQDIPQRHPFVERPFFFRPRRAVKQQCVALSNRGAQRCAVEAVIRRSLRLVAERETGEPTVALDRMQAPRDLMTHIVEPRGQWLADTVTVVAMPNSAGKTAHDRGADQPLGINDMIEWP